MCGRYTLKASGRELAERFGLAQTPEIAASYNIAPTQQIPIVLEDSPDGGRTLEMMHWGLIPSWAKDPSIGSRMINARAETVADKPSYRSAFKRRRCLIVADGFYEWKKTGDGKQPYYLRLKEGGPFGFAGLWEIWSMEGGEELTRNKDSMTSAQLEGIPMVLTDGRHVLLPEEEKNQLILQDFNTH